MVVRVSALADRLRAHAANGLHYFPDETDAQRFTALRGLAAELAAQVDKRSPAEIDDEFSDCTGPQTPRLGVVLVATRPDGARVVVQGRHGSWGYPRTLVRAAEHPLNTLERLIASLELESTGSPGVIGVYDGLAAHELGRHTYYLAVEVPVETSPATPAGVQWSVGGQTPVDTLSEHVLTETVAVKTEYPSPIEVPTAVTRICERVRALAVAGRTTNDPFNVARFHDVIQLIDRTVKPGGVDQKSLPKTETGPSPDTPTVGAEAVIFDDHGRVLLLRRHDTGQWAMPGGACEVGESAATTAVRETAEETGLAITIDRLVGMIDNRLVGAPTAAIRIIAIYTAHRTDPLAEATITAEAEEVGWFHPNEITDLDMFHGHGRKLEAALSAVRHGTTAIDLDAFDPTRDNQPAFRADL